MSELPSFVQRDQDLQEEVKTEIVKAVDGMFLLAQLHVTSLVRKRSPKAMRTALRKLPTGSEAYDHAYNQAMERIRGQVKDQEEIAMQVLSWITCAKRQLTIVELEHALAVEEGESALDEYNITLIGNMVSACAGLVTVDKESNIVKLVHYTTQEYFERTQNHWFPNAETILTVTCTTYLSFHTFESGYCQTYAEFEERVRLNQFYNYAANNWGYHASKALTLYPQVVDFLESKPKSEAASQLLAAAGPVSLSDAYYAGPRMTGLHLVAYFGVHKAASTLLKRGQHLDLKDKFSRTPLSYAAENGHEAVVNLLLDNGSELENRENHICRTPLLYAAGQGHEVVVKLLLEKGAEMEAKDIYGRTPLLYAIKQGHLAMTMLLLERGAELETKDHLGRTPLSYVAKNGNDAVAKLLLEKGAETEAKNYFGRTPLSYAAKNGIEGIVKLLLEKGAEIEAKTASGQSPLSYAAEYGQEAVVNLLLENGAKLETKDNDFGQTPLSIAARLGYKAVVKLLVDKGAKLETKDLHYGRTPLMWAEYYGHRAVVELLLTKNSVDSNAMDTDNWWPLLPIKDGVDYNDHEDQVQQWIRKQMELRRSEMAPKYRVKPCRHPKTASPDHRISSITLQRGISNH
ncbi:MAG: hypothetical protein M1829_005249 [Trizodia sp. TS-e1964]|nr:MAG: hypothetical protein M1829_005249 [Trizodia sp. TS-e1964]